MRMQRQRITLEMAGAQVRTLEELREHFDLEKAVEYFRDGQLERWLRSRFYFDEADAVSDLQATDKNDLAEKLCAILGVEYSDPETTAWRNERLARLKNFTSDENILRQVDDVAFDQDDLEDILSQEKIPATIYLCGAAFKFKSGILRIKNVCYVGIGNATVTVDGDKQVDFGALNITFKNIALGKAGAATNPKPAPATSHAERTTTVSNRKVHARPAASFFQTACKFKSRVSIKAKGKIVDAKSILMIMSLGLSKGTKITISADGPDASEAVDALIKLVDDKFGEWE